MPQNTLKGCFLATSTSCTRKQVQNLYFPLKCLIFSFCQTFYRYKWFSLIMQLKFCFFKGIVIEYNISKKTRFCCVYEKTCHGPIAKMLVLNMLYNHGKLCACIIKCTIALSFYTNRLDYLFHFSLFSISSKKWCTCVNHALKIDISYDDVETFST